MILEDAQIFLLGLLVSACILLIQAIVRLYTDGNYSPPSPSEMNYADATTSIYPDRPIRPLPKRRLRSRLSPGAVDSILYPQAASSPIGSTQGADPEGEIYANGARSRHEDGALSQSHHDGGNGKHGYQFKGNELGEDVEDGVDARSLHWRQKSAPMGIPTARNGYLVTKHDASRPYMKPAIAPSAASSGDSVDGYDSFENTNNKKKRKIPISGSLSNHHGSLSADMAHMNISATRHIDVSQADPDVGVGQYYGTGSSAVAASSHGSGISGSGRGRFGRSGARRYSGRSPLGVSFNGPNTTQAGRPNAKDGTGAEKSEAAPAQTSDQGIISAAIANAAAFPTTPVRGQENVSLLSQQSSRKPSSSKTQFTFTCESDSAKSVLWPGYGYSSPNGMREETPSIKGGGQATMRNNRGFSTQGTQTSPSMADQTNQPQPIGTNQPAPQQPRKPRRPLAKQLAITARERKAQQAYDNYNNPPKPEKFWICDFCEYEMIFGQPPEALIRQYEIKDRRERRRLAEKRRLLEKAKMKSRKGKKGKNNKNQNATQPNPPNPKQRYDPQTMDQAAMQSQGTQSDEYILDDYDDDPDDPVPALEPVMPSQTPSKIPQPVAHNQNHSLRPPGGNGIGTAGGAGLAA